jgi:hypothetical protein
MKGGPALLRRVVPRLALLLPAFVVFAAVAAKPVLTDTPVGTNSLLLVLGALAYLAACFLLVGRPAVLANLALLAWAVLLSGLAAAGVWRYVQGRGAARSVDAFEAQWERYFQGEDWYREYGREFRVSTQMQWHPYVLWRRRPFVGRYINVDAAGRRRTWNREAAGEPAAEVFAFGGSTLWGNGARDENTIPSRVSRLLDESGHRVRVTNYGELGFVSTQNLVSLALELRAGRVPALVFCYDGVNDAVASLQSREAGQPQLAGRMSGAMNRLYRDYYRSVTGLTPDAAPGAGRAESDDELVQQTVAAYLGNVRVIEHLAAAYGFKALFFWQPVAFVDKPLSAEERERVEPRRRAAGAFFEKLYAAMRATKAPAGLRDVSDVFASTPQTVYIDFCHVSEEGNRLVAKRISDEITRALSP